MKTQQRQGRGARRLLTAIVALVMVVMPANSALAAMSSQSSPQKLAGTNSKTDTSISCIALSLQPGASTTCTATVTSDGSTPVAPVRLSGKGFFSPSDCPLTVVAGSPLTGSCSATYTAPASAGPHNLHAHYNGDLNNNASNGKTSVAVLDILAPDLVLPLSFTVPATSAAGAFVTYSATATDNLDSSVSVICSLSSGVLFPVGTSTVNCTATDAAGNTATGSFTVTVVVTAIVDKIAPTVTASAGSYTGAWTNQDVTVSFDCADLGGSGLAATSITACAGIQTLTATGSSAALIVSDTAGNSTTSNTVAVQIDKIAPTVTAAVSTGTAGTNGWYTSDVTIGYSCADLGGSGLTAGSVTACAGTEMLIATGSSAALIVSDTAGNSTTSNTVAVQIDKIAPTVTASAGSYTGAWTNQDVTVSFDCADLGGSGLAATSITACAGIQTLTATGSSAALIVSDTAGNSTTSNTVAVQIDKIAPTVTAAVSTGTAGTNGWYTSDVTIGYSCADLGGSGLTAGSVTACAGTETLTTTGSSTALTVSDNADNSTTSNTVAVQIDKIAPTVTYSGATTYDVDQTIAITCTPSDAGGSGLASSTCTNTTGPAYNFGPGSTTLSATAIDNAGNTGSGSTTFTVKVTAIGLCNLTKTFASKPLGSSLCAQLNAAAAAKLRGNTQAAGNATAAYVREVQAQTGKAFTTWQAEILIRLVRGL